MEGRDPLVLCSPLSCQDPLFVYLTSPRYIGPVLQNVPVTTPIPWTDEASERFVDRGPGMSASSMSSRHLSLKW